MTHLPPTLRAGALPLAIGLGLGAGFGGTALANPCAMKRPAMMKKSPCNPCAGHRPMPMKAGNPCNPCNPCAAKKPMRMKANPCNPCAAHRPMRAKANPCNPCAAHRPMRMKANPCSPCNPCAAKKKSMGRQGMQVNPQAAKRLFASLLPTLKTTYRGGAHPVADGRWASWKNFATAPYIGETHGSRWLVNYANDIAAKTYGQYEKLRAMPAGGIIVKPSLVIDEAGRAQPGPLFVMEKMQKGWNPQTRDWRYAMIMPGGKTYGVTGGPDDAKVAFCADCHNSAAQTDALLFLPEEVRVR